MIRNARTISGQLHDELVMMDIEQGQYFALNPVATRIWQLLHTPLDLEALCGKLLDEYEVDSERCHREVEAHLDEMRKLGLVLLAEDES